MNFNKRINTFLIFSYRYLVYIYIFPSWFKYQLYRTNKFYFPAYFRFSSRERKSILNTIWDLLILSFKNQGFPFYYFHYGLYLKRIDRKFYNSYLPETQFYYKYLPKLNWNLQILDDKNLFESISKSNNLALPKTVLKIKNGITFDPDGQVLQSYEAVNHILKKIPFDNIICKPAKNTSGGTGIFTLHRIQETWYKDTLPFDNTLYKEIVRTDWIFQEKLINSPSLTFLKDTQPLSCIRILTYLNNGKAKVLYAALKMGLKNQLADNAHLGGMYVGIEIDSGRLLAEGFDEKFCVYTCVPDTNIKLNTIIIPNFEDVIRCSISAAHAFSDLRVVGWDIALSSQGVILIEGNSNPGLALIQKSHQGVEKLIRELTDEFN